jgi:hypothetical protein
MAAVSLFMRVARDPVRGRVLARRQPWSVKMRSFSQRVRLISSAQSLLLLPLVLTLLAVRAMSWRECLSAPPSSSLSSMR